VSTLLRKGWRSCCAAAALPHLSTAYTPTVKCPTAAAGATPSQRTRVALHVIEHNARVALHAITHNAYTCVHSLSTHATSRTPPASAHPPPARGCRMRRPLHQSRWWTAAAPGPDHPRWGRMRACPARTGVCVCVCVCVLCVCACVCVCCVCVRVFVHACTHRGPQGGMRERACGAVWKGTGL